MNVRSHFKKQIIFYIGLAQVIAAFCANVDWQHITLAGAFLIVSGMATFVAKYIQANMPDDDDPGEDIPLGSAQPGAPPPAQH